MVRHPGRVDRWVRQTVSTQHLRYEDDLLVNKK